MAKIMTGTKDVCRFCKRTVVYKKFGEIHSWAKPHWVHLATDEQVENTYCDGTPSSDLEYYARSRLPQGQPSGYCWAGLANYDAGSHGHCGAILREPNPYFACKRHFEELKTEQEREIRQEIENALSGWQEEQVAHFKEHLAKLLGPEEDPEDEDGNQRIRMLKSRDRFRWSHNNYGRHDSIQIKTSLLLEILNAPYEKPKVVTEKELETLYEMDEGMFE